MTVTMEGQRVGQRFDIQQAESGGEANALTSRSARVAAPIEVPFVRAPEAASYGANTPKAKIEIKNIDQLKAMTSAELEQLFENGRAPDAARFKGEMRGIALAAPYHDNTKLGRFVNWVMTKIPPWAGKNAMSAPGEGEEGQGKNRIFGGLFCPFEWNVVESRFDSMEG